MQRVLASGGFGSRRECELLIETGRVMVDNDVVQKLGTKVNPEKQKITIDGQQIVAERLEYFMLNKPPGVVSTSKDPTGRIRVIDLINTKSRVYNVGRLDRSSEGLILVTNDGDLANRLTHPRYGVAKTYEVQVQGEPSRETLKQLLEGIYLAEGFAKMANVKYKKRHKSTSWLEIVLEEGRNREIRRLLAKVGHKVLRLKRIAIGPLRLGELPLAAHRRLGFKELKTLKNAAATSTKRKPTPRRKPRTTSSTATPTQPASKQKQTASAAPKRSPSEARNRTSKPPSQRSTRKPSASRSAKKPTSRPPRRKPRK